MSTRDELRKGWCPSALRPMEAGDGLLLRVKPRAGSFSIDGLGAVADAARHFGSGEIDLTNRANLQLRGLQAETYGDALVMLDRAGLIDQHAEAEAVRNVVVDPLSGIDPERRDVRPDAAEIDARLAANRALWNLPGKFGVSLSGSNSPRVGGRATDIMVFVAGDAFAIALDGDPAGFGEIGDCSVAECVERLLYVFLTLSTNDSSIRRMRDAVARSGSTMIFAAGGLARAEAPGLVYEDAVPLAGDIKGAGRTIAAGVGLPFGRICAEGLASLCEVARNLGIASVRPSTGRVLVFQAGDGPARDILRTASDLNLITLATDIRLAMDVCPGAPSCANATTATRQDAQRLADSLGDVLQRTPSIHISGCQKGCARREPSALTFVGRDGAYDVVRDGTASDAVALTGVAPHKLGEVAQHILAGAAP